MTKVLVFESDAAFAETLVSGLADYGCETVVVDDGEAGIERAQADRPDLILLSIELPRMNGFSVCNKLKRSGSLKDVPLVLMSSEATDETFEQHKRLRTRAEEYVKKPIEFSALVEKVALLLPLERTAGPGPVKQASIVPPDVDSEADAAFGNIIQGPPPAADATEVEMDDLELEPDDHLEVAPIETPSDLEVEELEPEPEPVKAPAVSSEVLENLEKERARASALAADVARLEAELRSESDERRQLEQKKNAELELVGRELEELRAKLSSSQEAGTAREFLDLREQLNKKNKEILDIRDQLTSREKEVVRLNDTNIALERGKADLTDTIAALSAAKADLERAHASLTADKALSDKRAEEFEEKSKRLTSELETRTHDLRQAREHHENTMATRDAQEAALREDHRQELLRAEEKAKADQEAAVTAAVLARAEQALVDQEAALTYAAAEAKKAQDMALAVRAQELRSEHDGKMAALHRANEDGLRKLRAEHEQATKEALQLAAERLAARERELADEREQALASEKALHDAALSALADEKAKSEAARDARIGGLEADLAARTDELARAVQTISDREGRIAQLEADLAATRADLGEANEKFAREAALLSSARAKWTDDSAGVKAVSDALASALAELERIKSRPMP